MVRAAGLELHSDRHAMDMGMVGEGMSIAMDMGVALQTPDESFCNFATNGAVATEALTLTLNANPDFN